MSNRDQSTSVNQEIRNEQKKALGSMSFKQKMGYFWYYYKGHTIAGIIICIVAATLIYDIVTSKDTIFYGIMLNSFNVNGEELGEDFADFAGLDNETYQVFFDTTSSMSLVGQSEYDMATTQKISALIQTNELDIIVSTQDVFHNYAEGGMFLDLSSVMTAEELSLYEDYLFYIDAAEFEKDTDPEDYTNFEEPVPEELNAHAGTHKNPENMEQPVPVGIYVAHSPFISQTEAYLGMEAVYGISSTCARIDTAKQFLDYLFSGNVPEFSDPYFGS